VRAVLLENASPRYSLWEVYTRDKNLKTTITFGTSASLRCLPYQTSRRRLEAWYVLAFLRHHRPDFDSLSAVEQQLLLTKCCERVNEVLKSVRLLSDFLEYGLNDPLQGKIEV
jgi:hypothetical protein